MKLHIIVVPKWVAKVSVTIIFEETGGRQKSAEILGR